MTSLCLQSAMSLIKMQKTEDTNDTNTKTEQKVVAQIEKLIGDGVRAAVDKIWYSLNVDMCNAYVCVECTYVCLCVCACICICICACDRWESEHYTTHTHIQTHLPSDIVQFTHMSPNSLLFLCYVY